MASTKKNSYSILRQPRLTEKAAYSGDVVFEVHPRASKIEVKKAVEKIFNVKVASVRTLNYLGKPVRSGSRMSTLRNWKKAYVTLEKGQTLDLVEGL